VGPLALGPLHFKDAQESFARKHGELGASGTAPSRAEDRGFLSLLPNTVPLGHLERRQNGGQRRCQH
jgi:hypothetical protein